MHLELADIKAIVLNPQLKSSLWEPEQDRVAEILQDRIIAAIDYAVEGRDYRGTMECITKARIRR